MRESQDDSAFLTPYIKITQVRNFIFALPSPFPKKAKAKAGLQVSFNWFTNVRISLHSTVNSTTLKLSSPSAHFICVVTHTSKIGTVLQQEYFINLLARHYSSIYRP